jgi:hypothetical protein
MGLHNFQEATPLAYILFSSSRERCDWCCQYMRRTNTYFFEYSGYVVDVKTDYTLLRHSKGVCEFSRGHATCIYFIFLTTGLIRLMLSIHEAYKHIFQWIFTLYAQCKDCLYFAYAFQRCVQIFNRPLHLHVCYFPQHGTGMTHAVDTWGAQTHISINILSTCSM